MGSVQERCNSIANALGLRLSCTNPSICKFVELRPCWYWYWWMKAFVTFVLHILNSWHGYIMINMWHAAVVVMVENSNLSVCYLPVVIVIDWYLFSSVEIYSHISILIGWYTFSLVDIYSHWLIYTIIGWYRHRNTTVWCLVAHKQHTRCFTGSGGSG